MTMPATSGSAPNATVLVADTRPYLEWGPIIAGAIAASAISFLLLTFGGALGLTMSSPWPNEGASALAVALVVGLWTCLVQVGSFAAGGYLAGRMRSRWAESMTDEGQFRDGTHGFLVWAIGVLIGATVLGLAGGATLKTATQAASTIASGAATGAAAKGTELATGPADYAVDILFRPAPSAQTSRPQAAQPDAAAAAVSPAGTPATASPANTAPAGQMSAADARADSTRIVLGSIKNRELTQRDYDYLVRMVSARTGLPEAEAKQRVNEAMTEAKNLEIKARAAADKARKTAVIAAFLAAASLLIGCAAACLGAAAGGRHRDEAVPSSRWGSRFW